MKKKVLKKNNIIDFIEILSNELSRKGLIISSGEVKVWVLFPTRMTDNEYTIDEFIQSFIGWLRHFRYNKTANEELISMYFNEIIIDRLISTKTKKKYSIIEISFICAKLFMLHLAQISSQNTQQNKYSALEMFLDFQNHEKDLLKKMAIFHLLDNWEAFTWEPFLIFGAILAKTLSELLGKEIINRIAHIFKAYVNDNIKTTEVQKEVSVLFDNYFLLANNDSFKMQLNKWNYLFNALEQLKL